MSELNFTMQSKHFPNFILAGPAKSGTTSLYLMMRQHPQIFLPEIKEPRFFAYENVPPDYQGPGQDKIFNETTIYKLDDYLELFKNRGNALAIGDASPAYMHIPRSVETIKKYLPEVKIIILLRHPAERAYSAYLHQFRYGDEKLSFQEALRHEEKRIVRNWGIGWRYFRLGLIADQIECYLEAFGEEHIRFTLYDEFRKDNLKILRCLFSFLNVDQNFEPEIVKANVSGVIKHRWLNELLSISRYFRVFRPIIPMKYRRSANLWILNMQSKTIKRLSLPCDQFSELTKMYEEDILKTQALTGIDLSEWLKPIRQKQITEKNE